MKADQLEAYKKVRKTWTRNPKTQVKKNKKKSRQQSMVELKKDWREM